MKKFAINKTGHDFYIPQMIVNNIHKTFWYWTREPNQIGFFSGDQVKIILSWFSERNNNIDLTIISEDELLIRNIIE